jgi:putative component of membrane protein insertase Oxa1/YidC/SpoIIIJ protein YidD
MIPAFARSTWIVIRSTWIVIIAVPILILASFTTSYAQDPNPPNPSNPGGPHLPAATDLALIRGRSFGNPDEFAHYHGAGNNDSVLQNKHHSVIAEYNPVALLLKAALLGYQKLLSEQLARSCPYEITCSNFSKQSIQTFGAFKGVFISADRILRCNRIGLLDVSPISINPATGRIIDSPNMYR